MSNGGNVPLTIVGTYQTYDPVVQIGTNFNIPFAQQGSLYWFVVVDRTNLNVVVNTVSASEDQVPSDVQQYAGNPQYLLIFVSLNLSVYQVPQGALYTFLQQMGSAGLLSQAEQVSGLSSSSIGPMSYILAATMDANAGIGFEDSSYSTTALMTLQLMPVTVGGQTLYTPILLGA